MKVKFEFDLLDEDSKYLYNIFKDADKHYSVVHDLTEFNVALSNEKLYEIDKIREKWGLTKDEDDVIDDLINLISRKISNILDL